MIEQRSDEENDPEEDGDGHGGSHERFAAWSNLRKEYMKVLADGKGRNGGGVGKVGMLDFYPDDPSSNPAGHNNCFAEMCNLDPT